MPSRPIITLTTDFGLADGTVGAMIGVIRSTCPEADVVNVASEIPAHDIPRGEWALLQAAPFFPRDTIHVAVIDPGVGSNRRAVMAVTEHGTFVGPDNGILSWAVRQAGETVWRQLQNPAYRIEPVGVTFDGRDLFAPVAAHLAAGVDPATFGPVITDPVELEWPQPRVMGKTVKGESLATDHFGNLVTNVPLAMVAQVFGDSAFEVVPATGGGNRSRSTRGGKRTTPTRPLYHAPFVRTYAEITDKFGAVINGAGLIEIAANQGSASRMTGCQRGDKVVVQARRSGA